MRESSQPESHPPRADPRRSDGIRYGGWTGRFLVVDEDNFMDVAQSDDDFTMWDWEPTQWRHLPEGPRSQSQIEEPALAGDEVAAAGGSASLTHKSDCAVHNPPALPAGECNCGAGAAPSGADASPLAGERASEAIGSPMTVPAVCDATTQVLRTVGLYHNDSHRLG